MPDIYTEFYEPMRDRLAKVNLESALASIWCYSTYLDSGQELPPELRSPDPFLREKLHQGQLVEVAREAIMLLWSNLLGHLDRWKIHHLRS